MSENNCHVKKRQKGAALVEFAIAVPLLLLLLVGISEFAYAFYHLNILTKAVQDGARYFSNPLIAHQSSTGTGTSLSFPINVSTSSNGTNITAATNLVIYGSTTGTTQLLPGTAPIVTVSCVNETAPLITSDVVCPITSTHIQVSASYSHSFILGNTLNRLTNGAVPNNYTLAASSVLRVE